MSDADTQSAANAPRLESDGEPGLVRLAAGFYGVVLLFAVGYALFSGNHEIKKILAKIRSTTQSPA